MSSGTFPFGVNPYVINVLHARCTFMGSKKLFSVGVLMGLGKVCSMRMNLEYQLLAIECQRDDGGIHTIIIGRKDIDDVITEGRV